MQRSSRTTVRKGQMYHFVIDGTEYTAFIWEVGKQFCGRIQDNPQIPEFQGHTILAVRNALFASITKSKAT